MTKQEIEKKIEEFEKERQAAISHSLRLEGAIAVLQQLLAMQTSNTNNEDNE